MGKMILIDEAKLSSVLEALEGIHPGNMTPMAEDAWNKATTALREALAQPAQPAQQHIEHCLWARNGNQPCPHVQPAPVQEPMTFGRLSRGMEILAWNRAQAKPPIEISKEQWVADELERFYTTPQAQPAWEPLKPEEAKKIWQNCVEESNEGDDVIARFISIIEPMIRSDERLPLTDSQANDIMEKESWGSDAITLNASLLRTIRRTESAHGIGTKKTP